MATNEMAKGGGIKQTKPQETDSTYSKAIDKRKGGKPVGYRFTDKLAKKLGKKPGTKPTAAEIEKYKNRGVYFETRKNKSDLNPKAKLEMGGENEYAKGGKMKEFLTYDEINGLKIGKWECDVPNIDIGGGPVVWENPSSSYIFYAEPGFDGERKLHFQVEMDEEMNFEVNFNAIFFKSSNPLASFDKRSYLSEIKKVIDIIERNKDEELTTNDFKKDFVGVKYEKYAMGGDVEYAKGGQTSPQRESYSKRGDKEVKAKPVGYRFTEKLANRLGKNVFTKPTQEQIEKYRGKGIYFENRKDKSDINPRAMFEDGGDMEYAKGGETKEFLDWNDIIGRKIGSWKAYDNNGISILWESNKSPYYFFAAPGFDADVDVKDYPNHLVIEIHEIDNDDLDIRLISRDKDASYDMTSYLKEVKKAIKIIDNAGKNLDEDDLTNDFDMQKRDEYGTYHLAKGGQTAPQRESYSKRGDQEVKAKPVGYRFTEKLANRLGKNVYTKPTQEQVEKYRGRGVYFENRKDKSDINPRAMFEHGGDMEYAKGGFFEHGLRKGDKIVEGKSGNFLVVVNDGKEYMIDISKGERYPMKGNTVYPAVKNPKKENGGDVEYAKGGQTSPQRESYSKRGDQEVKAKPVGYRFTKSLAKRLGKNPFTKPTAEQVRKYLGKGVYFENRKDKSDINPRAMFEQGGDMEYAKGGQTAPQETDSTYSKSIDKRRGGKPVGYRFTNKLAKKLGKNPQTAPKSSEIEKYSGKGVYFETRKNKSDLNPKAKLEGGGESEYARGGGVPRTSNADSKAYTENHLPFMANNLEGKTLENGDYVVLSYGYYPIWFWHKRTNKWYGNKDKFSVTTAKQISQSRPTYEAEMLSRGEMDSLMSKSIEGKDFKEMGGTLDSFVVAQQ